jgi:hypothetical protein
MGKKSCRIIGASVLFLLSFSVLFTAPKLSIRVQGKWTRGNFDAADLTGGAGSDFSSPQESAFDQIDVDVTKTNNYWQVEISKADNPWPASVHVWVLRTIDGIGSQATITGGTAYQQVTSTNQPFFSGTGDISAIKIQVKLENFSMFMGMDDYTTTLSYTVTDGYPDWP